MTSVADRAHAADLAAMDREAKAHREKFPNSERVLEAIGRAVRGLTHQQMYDGTFRDLEGQADNLLDLQEQGQDISAELADEWMRKLEGAR